MNLNDLSAKGHNVEEGDVKNTINKALNGCEINRRSEEPDKYVVWLYNEVLKKLDECKQRAFVSGYNLNYYGVEGFFNMIAMTAKECNMNLCELSSEEFKQLAIKLNNHYWDIIYKEKYNEKNAEGIENYAFYKGEKRTNDVLLAYKRGGMGFVLNGIEVDKL